jgi:uncharacterized protein (TIGR03435 family)
MRQNGNPMTRDLFTSFWIRAAWALGSFGAAGLCAQAPQQNAGTTLPSFEVASVKAHDASQDMALRSISPADLARGDAGAGGRFVLRGYTLTRLLMKAFDLQPDQVGGPKWLNEDRFDVFANAPAGATPDQYPPMFQNLLAERFKLQFHFETPITSVYELSAAPEGAKLKPGVEDPDPENYGPIKQEQTGPADARVASVAARAQGLGIYHLTVANGHSHYDYENIPVGAFAQWVRNFLDLPLVDSTGLSGRYEITLDVPMGHGCRTMGIQAADQAVPVAVDPCTDTVTSVVASFKKQGLSLDRRKLPYRKLVVDHVERTPTGN